MEVVEADIELTERDHVDAQLGRAKATNAYRGLQKTMGIILVFTACIVWATRFPVPGVWTAMTVCMLAGLVLVRQQWVWVGKKNHAMLPAARRRFRVRIDRDGIHQKGPKAEVNLTWAAVKVWHETEQTLMVCGPTGVLAFWGKRHFDDDALLSLRALLKRHIEVPQPDVTQANATQPEAGKSNTIKTFALWLVLIVLFVAVYQLVNAP